MQRRKFDLNLLFQSYRDGCPLLQLIDLEYLQNFSLFCFFSQQAIDGTSVLLDLSALDLSMGFVSNLCEV